MSLKKLIPIAFLVSGMSFAATTYTLVESKNLPELPYDELVDLQDKYGADKVVYGSPFTKHYTLSETPTIGQNANGKYFAKGNWSSSDNTLSEEVVFTTGDKDTIIRNAELTFVDTGLRTTGAGLYYLLNNLESSACLDLTDAEDPNNDDKDWQIKLAYAMLTPDEQQGEIKEIKRPLAYHGVINNLKVDIQIDPQSNGYNGHLQLATTINPGPGAWANYCTMDKDVKLDIYK